MERGSEQTSSEGSRDLERVDPWLTTGQFSLDYKYPVVLRALFPHEGAGYLATIPYLGDGTFNGVGETPVEALECLDETMRILIPDLLEDGWELPKPWTEEEIYFRNVGVGNE